MRNKAKVSGPYFVDERGNQVSVSIHPRNWGLVVKGQPKGVKQNTCARRNDNRKGTLAKREKVRNARRTAMSATMSDVKKALAFRMPGSLRGW